MAYKEWPFLAQIKHRVS